MDKQYYCFGCRPFCLSAIWPNTLVGHQVTLPGGDHTVYEQSDMHVAAVLANKKTIKALTIEMEALGQKYRGFVGFVVVDKWVLFLLLLLLCFNYIFLVSTIMLLVLSHRW